MKQQDNPINITNLNHDGRGIAKLDGKTQFILNALPNETVKYAQLRKHKRFDEGIANEIINASPDRIEPKCKHFGMCGGCQLQHMDTQAQLLYKQAVVLEQMKHIGKIEPEQILAPINGDIYGYRNKARLGAKYVEKKQKMLVGFRELNGRFIADLSSCPILTPAVGERLTNIADLINSLSCHNQIPQIEIAAAEDNQCVLIFRNLATLNEDDNSKLKLFGEQFNFTICLQPSNYESIYQVYPEGKTIPELYYTIPEHQIKITFHPADFTQVNQSTNLQMIDKAIELLQLKKSDKVLDLFCGLGNFTLPIARYVKQITGIEGDLKMVQKSGVNATVNNIDNIDFYAQNLFEPEINAPWFNQTYDKLLLDPPRAGAEQICKNINQFAAERIVYISCNSATLARDAGFIVQHGYKLAKLGIINMFPQTAHVETIALFLKQ